MGKTAMKIGDPGGRMLREEGEDMRFALGQARLSQRIKIKSDSMGGPVNRVDESECHKKRAVSNQGRSRSFERCR